MSVTQCGGNITSGFVDLATFDELEKFHYGGQHAVTYFVRETRKASWFTQVPVCLVNSSGQGDFGQEFSVNVSRAGDYMLYNWMRVTLPKVQLKDNSIVRCSDNEVLNPDDDMPVLSNPNSVGADAVQLRWSRNIMHNLLRETYLSFNDLVEVRFDNYFLDFWSKFTIPACKAQGYANMIGDVDVVTDPISVRNCPGEPPCLNKISLLLPLPYAHSRDSGVALPTAALPYNEMRLHFCLRRWQELLLVTNTYDACEAMTTNVEDLTVKVNGLSLKPGESKSLCDASCLSTGEPKIDRVEVWANYAIVSNNERQLMGQNPRDILIEQVQSVSPQSFDPTSIRSIDLRLSHAVKALFFSVRNKTISSDWSNYTSASYVGTSNVGDTGIVAAGMVFDPAGAADPVSKVSLSYESSLRLSNVDADYFSLIQPYYHAVCIPTETGYHMYSYSLDLMSVDPMGSTNYGKLTNVSLCVEGSDTAKAHAKDNVLDKDGEERSLSDGMQVENLFNEICCNGNTGPDVQLAAVRQHHGVFDKQSFCLVVNAINHNIVRVSGGALGFPVL